MGFEYFCGANVFVTIGDMPILEVAGLSVSISENKRPIYGYASRHFNAVARGNVLVQGQLLINYIHQDYLYHAIKLGMNEVSLANDPIEFNTNFDAMSAVSNAEVGSAQAMAELQRMYWNSGGLLNSTIPNRNPHDAANGINLKVIFGDENTELNGSSGKVNYVISNLHFLGRSSVINISEDVLIESYSFIARDIIGINRPSKQVVTRDPDFDNLNPLTSEDIQSIHGPGRTSVTTVEDIDFGPMNAALSAEQERKKAINNSYNIDGTASDPWGVR
jgi:hypothetical protein